ncbi:hypothetical protein [Streptomyces sp. NPDC088785]|uniref:hypothetical protein n=1 Tax=Streptomyces sp. NPDC088785 TaxID=3365897 RepID=UPI0038075F78
MSTDETSRFVRLKVELVLEVVDGEALAGGALQRVAEAAAAGELPEREREHAESAVQEDEAEAVAYLVDPFDLVGDVPGAELVQASWSSEQVDYDPDSPDWDLDEDDDAEDAEDGV